eukprot:symbB.v1.2.032516.t1/scaffold3913.1/size48432/4
MAVYITGQSQMNWGNVGEYPPYWNVESQQWGVCARVPHTHMTLANPIDLWHIWPGPKPAKGSWKDWQDAPEPPENASKWQCRWENEERDPDASSSSRPARGQSRGRSPEKHAKGSSKSLFSKRYLSRGYHSQMRREERARYRERGEPIPPHLEVQQAFVCKELKRAMWELQQQSRQNVRATCVDEIPKPEEAEDVNMEHAEEPEEAMPVRGRSREGIVGANLRQSKMGPRSLTPIGRGTPAQPAESGFLKEEMPEEAELPEEEGEYEDEEMEGLPERRHENEAWAEAGVKQYYFEKKVSHLEKLSHESLTKASQQVGGEALNDQDFERVEAHLQVTGPPQRMLLGSASSSAKGASKKSLEEAYAEHLEKCKHLEEECDKALGKLESLTEAFKLENGKNPTAQLEASKTELESLQESYTKKKKGTSKGFWSTLKKLRLQ